ncbi:hypothetical protein ACK8P5_25835 (plasmid) [Paenibacillus sp. EC2-1]|uniref:hypothetical protein n=1 Tax=Paenibacillus sp. EC2-1 TaxID=3388665 RepID=UPI003BEF1991
MLPIQVDQVRALSQSEGLFDHEIADRMGCHRTTVTRCRLRYGIPHTNLANRRDKIQTCKRCGQQDLIYRKDRILKYCGSCRDTIEDERREKKHLRDGNKSKKHSEGMLLTS